MNDPLFVFAWTLLFYFFIGVVVRAACLCYHADDDGYVGCYDRANADVLLWLWPVFIVFLFFRLLVFLSDKMFNLCFKRKYK